MEKSSVKLSITTPDGAKLKRTITEHENIEELLSHIENFIKETNEAIESGKTLSITCSKCCVGLSFKNCVSSCMSGNDTDVKNSVV
jgi:hypothetical protein